MTRDRVVASLIVVALGIGCQQASAPISSNVPVVGLSFRGVWFSEAEMQRLSVGEKNVSPTRDIELKAWEYTDPVGTPHPEIVSVVVRVTNPANATARDVRIGVREQWKIAGPDGESTAVWENPLPERYVDASSRLSPGTTTEARFEVGVGQKVRTLGADDRYPWRLKVIVALRDASSNESLAAAESELPIIPGD